MKPSIKQFAVAAAGTALFLCFMYAVASAQTSMTQNGIPVAPITLGTVINPWLQWLSGVVLAIVGAATPILIAMINKKFGIENDANVAQMEKQASETLQSAATNAAGQIVMGLGQKLNGVVLTANHPEVATAVQLVNRAAGDAIKRFGLTDQQIANLVINKVGVLTAANPTITPVSKTAEWNAI